MRRRRTGTRVLAAALALGTAAGGLAGCGGNGSPQSRDEGIRDFDFGNAAFIDAEGEKQQFEDGHVTVEGYEDLENAEGRKVGWNIAEGPVYSDADDDGDLDAAIVYTWVPAGGADTYVGYVWTWDDGEATQLRHPIQGGNYGAVKDLKAGKHGFSLTAVSRPFQAPAAEQDGVEETFTFGVADGFPAQTKPDLGSVDRCVLSDNAAPGARGDGTPPRLAPDEDAPAIGAKDDFEQILTVTNEAPKAEGWELARAERTDGTVSCGWIKTEWAGQS